jgi:hypothetical protein
MSVRTAPRARPALLSLAALLAVLAAGCVAGPVAISPTMPVSGSWFYGTNVTACAPKTGPVQVDIQFKTSAPDWVKVNMADGPSNQGGFIPQVGPLRWEWTSAPVNAGSCLNFVISSGCSCCDPCPPPLDLGFDWAIYQP